MIDRPNSNPRRGSASGLFMLVLCFALGLGASAWYFQTRGRHPEPTGTPAGSTSPAPGGAGPGGAGVVPVTDPAATSGGDPLADDSRSSPLGAGTTGEREAATEEIYQGRRTAVVRAAELAGPSVVSVTVSRIVQGRGRVVQDFFSRWYVPGPRYKQRVPAGSGVIVDGGGIILTNHHVVMVGEEYEVTLSDGRTFPAELRGTDANYDLAVLQVAADGLPQAEVGTSSDLMVGEWAIALGNPFGDVLKDPQPTVTVGVISALHRDVQSDDPNSDAIYKDLIQTDAAINPGNSGGPLVNANGQLIGINTVILSRSGGSEGIGFAIPVDTAVRVSREILQYGRSRQIWIGATLRTVTPWLAQQLRLKETGGVIVAEIEAGSPAARAGVRGFNAEPLRFDIIRKIDGEVMTTNEQAYRTFFGSEPGTVFRLTVERENGRLVELEMKVDLAPMSPRGSAG
ncbi:MAG: trypsin-like peptidase domain-containing protein [Candidatus Eisenbacteria bacterium]|nr:trypsin-like peptidase domain-containing protein [Candidatus Eisenbacteria bacterium]